METILSHIILWLSVKTSRITVIFTAVVGRIVLCLVRTEIIDACFINAWFSRSLSSGLACMSK